MIIESNEDSGQVGHTKRNLIDGTGIIEVSIADIHIREPQRNFKTKNASDKNLVESIKNMGVLEPLLVQPREDHGFLLVAGERRYQASIKAGLKTVPVRVFRQALSQENFLLIQMVENFQRESLDPIAEARGYLSYAQMMLGCLELKDSIAKLILHGRNSRRLDVESAEKVSALETISGKTSRTIQNILKLLTLPSEAQQAVIDGRISISQGYILAKPKYSKHPRLVAVLQEGPMQGKMTTKNLISLFEGGQGIDPNERSTLFRKDRNRLRRIMAAIERNKDCYGVSERKDIQEEVKMLLKTLDTMVINKN